MSKIISVILAVVFTVVGFNFGVDQAQAATVATQKPFIVGAPYDVPFGLVPDAVISSPEERTKAIEEAAKALALGKNIVVAGGSAGPISDEMFESIIQESGKINQNHAGSIIRIGGQDMQETRQLMNYFMVIAHYF